jgi:hypothetical protein
MIEICKLQIDATRKLLKEQNIGLDLSQKAFDQLAKEGYDPVYGARPLRRLIQRSIENPIAIYLIQKTIVPGETILVDYDPAQDKYIFSKARMAAPDPAVGASNANGIAPAGAPEGQPPVQPSPDGAGQAQQMPVDPAASANGQSAAAPNGELPQWLNNVTEAAQGGSPVPVTPPTQGTDGTQMQPQS